MKMNQAVLRKVIKSQRTGKMTDKKIAVYSHQTAIILKYLDIMYPKFSPSRAAKEILVKHAEKNFPEAWEHICSKVPNPRGETSQISEWKGKSKGLNQPDIKALDQAVFETTSRNDKILTVYGPQLSVFYEYLTHTIPRFTVSRYAAEILETGIEAKYPKIWRRLRKHYAIIS